MSHLVLRVSLVAIWLLAWGDLSWANVLSGIVVSSALLALFPVGRADHRAAFRPAAVVRLGAHFLADLVRSNLMVARQVLRRHPDVPTAIVAYPLRSAEPTELTVLANLLALSPGTMPVDVTAEPPTIHVHVLLLEDAATVKERVAHLEALVISAVGSPQAVAALSPAPPRHGAGPPPAAAAHGPEPGSKEAGIDGPEPGSEGAAR